MPNEKGEGVQVGKDAPLTYDPCSLSFFCDGEFILCGGSDRKVSLYTREGVFLRVVAEVSHWAWAIRGKQDPFITIRSFAPC